MDYGKWEARGQDGSLKERMKIKEVTGKGRYNDRQGKDCF